MIPQPGAMVTPVVRLVSQLGAGGMGSIWLADHLSLNAPVVVKFMMTELAANAEARKRFAREASAAAQLRSPHVVQVFDHGVTDSGAPYIVMELLDGRDLASLIEDRGRLPPSEVLHVIAQVGKALGKAHAQGIIHRDIKPENIFLCGPPNEEPFVKLLDFGIAKAPIVDAAGVSTRTGALLGTPLYMSPEQVASGKEVDARADIWALGVVVFEALTGEKPFVADDFGSLVLLLHNSPPPRITARVPSLPPAIDSWFARACARAATDRYQSVQQLVDGLRDAFRIDAPAPSPPAQPPPAAPRLEALPAATKNGGAIAVGPITNASMASSLPGVVPIKSSRLVWVGAGLVLILVSAGATFGLRNGGKTTVTTTPPHTSASAAPLTVDSVSPTDPPSTVAAVDPPGAPAPTQAPSTIGAGAPKQGERSGAPGAVTGGPVHVARGPAASAQALVSPGGASLTKTGGADSKAPNVSSSAKAPTRFKDIE